MTIDSHVHFWKYNRQQDTWITDNMKILRQDYLPEHLIQSLKRNNVDGCVAVQAGQTGYETHFLAELAGTHPEIKAVVGWVDLQSETVSERLDYFSQYPIIKGWRHVVQNEPDDFLLRENFQRGIRALAKYDCTYDVLIYHHQLKPALKFVSKFPQQKFIIDHCAKPDIRKKTIDEWGKLMKEMAKQPNVFCKISGLLTEAGWKTWSAKDFYPYLDIVFEAFGTSRLLFGSDWPVMLLSGIYVQWKSLLEKYMESFPEEDRQRVFGGNAVQFYKL
ncbi:MAG: amidohydrolase family protein [Bacteroidota bacterium]